jgi:polar amino acid transport system substrate-binding protein
MSRYKRLSGVMRAVPTPHPIVNSMRSILLLAICLAAAVGAPSRTQAQQTPAAEIASTGRLRVGFQTGSPILARRASDGSVHGVAVDLGKFIAEKLALPFDPVVYVDQEAYAQSFGKGEWDLVIGARSSLAERGSDMGPDFMLADAMYIAAPGREFADATGIDRPGVKVGVSQGGGSDQFLSRVLQSAQVVRVPGGVPNAVEALRTGTVDVWAANPVTLQEIGVALPGSMVIPGAWTTGRYAASLPKGRSPAAQQRLAQIVNEAKRTGFVQEAIERAGFKGVRVAPE